MNIITIISYAGFIVWLFPPIKQYKTKYFNYFLIGAVFSPISLICLFLLKLNANYLFPAGYLCMLAVLINDRKKYFVFFLAAAAAICFPLIRPSNSVLFSISLVVDFLTFLIIVQRIIELFIKRQQINLFLTLFFIYLSIDLVKLFDFALSTETGVIYFFWGELFQQLLAVAFCFINVNTKNFKVKIKALEAM